VGDEKESDEVSLVARICAGDRDLFRMIVETHKDAVFSCVMRQVGVYATAEELTQDIFLRAYRGLRSFRGDSALRTWLIRIALNTTNSYFGSKRYRQQIATDVLDPLKHDRGIEMEPQDSAQIVLFRKALGSLPPKLRYTLVLCGLEGKKYEEAADILGIPVGTVRSRLNKARLLVKTAIGGYASIGGSDETE